MRLYCARDDVRSGSGVLTKTHARILETEGRQTPVRGLLLLKQELYQAPFRWFRPVKGIGIGMMAALWLVMASPVANAQSLCTATCPKCCSNPDTLLKQQFRGPVPLNGLPRKSLDEWYVDSFWPLIDQKIKAVTNQINMGITNEATRRGSLMNAQNHVGAITSLQKGSAKASKNYLGSESMCRFATLSQGLSATEGKASSLKLSMNKRSLDRQLLTKGYAAATNTVGKNGEAGETQGQSADKNARWKQYLKTFCNPSDYSQGKAPDGVCETTTSSQYNKDINFAATLWEPASLNISGTASTKDAQNLDALADNLYAHDLVNNMPQNIDPNAEGSESEIRKYMLLRSVIAKRAVAENTFTSIAAMKAAGTPASAKYTENLMIELGIPKAQAKEFVGENPSYYAQMEALTRKMYESPAFYTNLMEGPINVKRQQAAMKSLELMQQRDLYKSLQRSELLMATLLDIYVSREQGGVEKKQVQSEQ